MNKETEQRATIAAFRLHLERVMGCEDCGGKGYEYMDDGEGDVVAEGCDCRTYAQMLLQQMPEGEQLVKRIMSIERVPTIVCLCGSTRFYEEFQRANFRETMAGRIVLSVGFYPHAVSKAHGEDVGITADEKTRLDDLHKRKIDLADEILVLNVNNYIGDSTRSEIEYAQSTGKRVRWLV